MLSQIDMGCMFCSLKITFGMISTKRDLYTSYNYLYYFCKILHLGTDLFVMTSEIIFYWMKIEMVYLLF